MKAYLTYRQRYLKARGGAAFEDPSILLRKSLREKIKEESVHDKEADLNGLIDALTLDELRLIKSYTEGAPIADADNSRLLLLADRLQLGKMKEVAKLGEAYISEHSGLLKHLGDDEDAAKAARKQIYYMMLHELTDEGWMYIYDFIIRSRKSPSSRVISEYRIKWELHWSNYFHLEEMQKHVIHDFINLFYSVWGNKGEEDYFRRIFIQTPIDPVRDINLFAYILLLDFLDLKTQLKDIKLSLSSHSSRNIEVLRILGTDRVGDIETLELTSCVYAGAVETGLLCESLARKPTLRHLKLVNATGVYAINMIQNVNLQSLVLLDCKLENYVVDQILKRFTALKHLTLRDKSVNRVDVTSLQTLVTLDLSEIPRLDHIGRLPSTLEILRLKTDKTLLTSIWGQLPAGLRELYISTPPRAARMGDEGCDRLAEVLENLSELRSLTLEDCGITRIGRLCSSIRSITHLNLSGNAISDIEHLLELPSQLTDLNLSACSISHVDRARVVAGLLRNHPNIKRLILDDNRLDDEGISELADSIIHLRELSLKKNLITDPGLLLKRQLSLETLNISDNRSISSWDNFFTRLTHLSNVKVLVLHELGLYMNFIYALSENMDKLPNLKVLDLRLNLDLYMVRMSFLSSFQQRFPQVEVLTGLTDS